VVAADAGSLPEVCGDAALLVNPRNPSDMADALERVITDEALRAELVSKGHVQTERFSVARSATEMDALYRRLAAEGSSS
jgi:glycosyltransferase involved in cell wall biosynthesis